MVSAEFTSSFITLIFFQISWKGVKGYYLQFRDFKNITIDSPVKEDEFFVKRIDDLVPGTNYKFMIAARTSKGFGKSFELSDIFIPSKGIINVSILYTFCNRAV